MDIRFQPSRIVKLLAWAVCLLFLLHLASWIPVFAGWDDLPIKQINLCCEQNLPTLFSSFLLGSCALLTWLIAHAEHRLGRGERSWMALALAFLLLGVDETIMIHEKVGSVLHAKLQTTGMFRYAWVLPYMVLMFIFAAALFPFYLRLPRDTRLWISVAAILYVTGGMGIEMIEGSWVSTFGRDAVFHILRTLEELFEMAGCIVFVYAFTRHIDRHVQGLNLRITSASDG